MQTTRELFRQHSLRCTAQRQAVYEALRICRCHPTADELFRIVQQDGDSLSLATVYNTLDALCEAGLIRRHPTTNGCCRYDADTSSHVHVRFPDTAEIEDVPTDVSERIQALLPAELLQQVAEQLGVDLDAMSIQLIARRRCPACDSRPNGNGSPPKTC